MYKKCVPKNAHQNAAVNVTQAGVKRVQLLSEFYCFSGVSECIISTDNLFFVPTRDVIILNTVIMHVAQKP